MVGSFILTLNLNLLKSYPKVSLLPNYFKIIAYVIAGSALTLPLLSFNERLNLDQNIFIPLGKYLFLLALVFFSFSKMKNETARCGDLRLKCLPSAIIFVSIFYLFKSFIELFKPVEHRELMTAYEVLLIFHIYYSVSFYYYKNK